MKIRMSIIITEIERIVAYYMESIFGKIAILMPSSKSSGAKENAVIRSLRKNENGGYFRDKIYYTDNVSIACSRCDVGR